MHTYNYSCGHLKSNTYYLFETRPILSQRPVLIYYLAVMLITSFLFHSVTAGLSMCYSSESFTALKAVRSSSLLTMAAYFITVLKV